MNNSGVYVGLDIGTTAIKVVISQMIGNQLNVIGAGNIPSKGLRRGVIVDIDETAQAIHEAVVQAQEKANVLVSEVIVGIPANQLEIVPITGLVSVANANKRITLNDVQAVTEQALSKAVPTDYAVIDVVADEFIVDGFDGIKDPNEMIGVRLEMKEMAYVGPKALIENTKLAVRKAGLLMQQFVLSPLAMANGIFDDGEQEFGTILIDLGGGQTTATVMHDHKLKFTYVDPEGGEYVTKDIATVLSTSMATAERIKRNHGYADSSQTNRNNRFNFEAVNGQSQTSDENYLSEIIEARLNQIFTKIYDKLALVSAFDLPGGVVLTGGNAALPRIQELAKRYFGENIRLFIPQQIGLRHPTYTRSYAYTQYAATQSSTQRTIKNTIMSKHMVQQYEQEESNDLGMEYQAEINYSQVDDQNYSDAYTEYEQAQKQPAKPKGNFIQRMIAGFRSLIANRDNDEY